MAALGLAAWACQDAGDKLQAIAEALLDVANTRRAAQLLFPTGQALCYVCGGACQGPEAGVLCVCVCV